MTTQAMDTRRELAAGRGLARSALYQLLSQALSYPSQETLETLAEVDLPQAQRAANHLPAQIAPMLTALEEHVQGTDVVQLQAEHRRVFTHILSPDCPPCETLYTAPHIFQETQELADIRGFFRAFGLEPAERERPDHITVELEFMHFVTYKEAYALLHHGSAKARLCREAQRKFMQDHLGRWAVPFARRLEEKAGGGYFGAVASLAETFISAEVAFLGARPAAAVASPDWRTVSAEDEGCAATDECPLVESGRDAYQN
jgi:DMSO reductase family type II enzyme chaperone